MLKDGMIDSFTDWARLVEPRLRQALTGAFGPQIGKEAAADALSHAWENWGDVRAKDNPLGYTFGVGRNLARRSFRAKPVFVAVDDHRLPHVEPGLPKALARLPERQRVVITLVYGYEWTLREVADLLQTSKSTVQSHAERGLKKLRKSLGVEP